MCKVPYDDVRLWAKRRPGSELRTPSDGADNVLGEMQGGTMVLQRTDKESVSNANSCCPGPFAPLKALYENARAGPMYHRKQGAGSGL